MSVSKYMYSCSVHRRDGEAGEGNYQRVNHIVNSRYAVVCWALTGRPSIEGNRRLVSGLGPSHVIVRFATARSLDEWILPTPASRCTPYQVTIQCWWRRLLLSSHTLFLIFNTYMYSYGIHVIHTYVSTMYSRQHGRTTTICTVHRCSPAARNMHTCIPHAIT